jgi:hypothetical protein
MNDRGQFTTPGSVRLLVGVMIALLVLALIINEALSAPSLATGEVEQVCGLCHVDWRRQAALVVGLGGLLVVANRLLAGRQPPEGETEDDS